MPPLVLESRVYETIARAGLRAADRDLVSDLCRYVVDVVPQLDVPHRGHAARSAAQLLLAECVPALTRSLRDDAARLCEVAVVRGL